MPVINAAPPDTPCEVRIVESDGREDFARLERYDAAGHLLFGTMRLTYGGHGYERFTWEGDHVVAIETFHEAQAWDGKCEVEGGCREPATRTFEQTSLRYDGPRLVEQTSSLRTYFMDPQRGGEWLFDDETKRGKRYRYDRDHLIASGPDYFDYDGDHVVAKRSGKFRYGYEWKGDQLATYRWSDYTEAFAHDADGRLVEHVTSNERDYKSTRTWSYDAAGRMIRSAENTGSEVATTYEYDDAGRLVRTTIGGVTRTRTYTGTCPRDLGQPKPPNALYRAGEAIACVKSPGGLYTTCE